MRILKLTPETQNDILQNLLKRSPNNYGEFEGRVNAIIEEVRKNRDQAIFSYTKQFDGADINADNILVTEAEIQEAYEQVDETLLSVIRKSLVNIKKYHEKQMQNSWFTSEDGIILGQKVTALATVGVYVPGGKAVYPSSVLMNVLPAKVAGVDRIVMCTQFIYNGENIKYNGNEKEQIQEITKMKKGERVLEWNAGKCCCRIYGSLSYEELKEIAKNVEVKI